MLSSDDDDREVLERLARIRSSIKALDGDPNEALGELKGKDDPDAVFRQLAILVEEERFQEGASLVRGQPPHERWCELAVAALIADGDEVSARCLVDWAHSQSDRELWPRCVNSLARYRYLRALRNRSRDVAMLPGELSEEEATEVRLALQDVAPLVNAVASTRRLTTGNEVVAVALAMDFHHWLGEHAQSRQYAELLRSRQPIPIQYAIAVLRGQVEADDELPARLRTERPESFDAQILALLIEGKQLGRAREAIHEVDRLAKLHPSLERQGQLASALDQLAAELPGDEAVAVRAHAMAMTNPRGAMARLHAVERLIQENRLDEAKRQLEELEDHTSIYWLQLAAVFRARKGDYGGAADVLLEAIALFPEPDLLRQAASASIRSERLDDAARVLRRLVMAFPSDIPARADLALLYSRTGQNDAAAEQYKALSQLDPDNVGFKLNHAIALAKCLRLEESLSVYDGICDVAEPPVKALLGRAHLLQSLDRPADAFASLETHKDRLWNVPEFVQAFVSLGFASRREREASQGLLQLQHLEMTGAAQGIFKTAGIDDVKKLFAAARDGREHLADAAVRGTIPWLSAATLTGMAVFKAWWEHTCPRPWIAEGVTSRGAFGLYSTNSFGAFRREGGRLGLERIESAPAGATVAFDLSSLITLHHLGLLERATAAFGRCLVASSYRELALADGVRLSDHQESRKVGHRAIKVAVDAGKIKVSLDDASLPRVDEYAEESQTVTTYRLADLITPLQQAGVGSDAELSALAEIAERAPLGEAAPERIKPRSRIRISLLTLESLHGQGLLSAIIDGFDVHLSPEDVDLLRTELAEWDVRATLYRGHSQLWDALRADPHVVFVSHMLPPEMKPDLDQMDSASREAHWLGFFGAAIACDQQIPLAADDRVIHVYMQHRAVPSAWAFGTDALIEMLASEGRLTSDERVDVYLKLIEWRYRFIVIPAEVLETLARRHLKSLPGRPLRRIAKYVQDCMRDPGLFVGMENTDPPTTVATKLFLAWTSSVSELCMALWEDPSVEESVAEAYTAWALSELLPTPPRKMGPLGLVLTAEVPKWVLTQAFVKSATIRDQARARSGLTRIADAFGVTRDEYTQCLRESLNVI